MAEWDDNIESEHDGAVATETEEKVEKPPMYKVLLHNDHYTTMEFVTYVLQAVFHKSASDADRIMWAVHFQGVGVAGVYTYEIGEAKVNKVTQLARAEEFPLLCTLEAE
jgi:ATP-dependent Clp protease adaptor protein ClpS